MTKQMIKKLILDDPQVLVDTKTVVQFTDGSTALLLDGWAAGSSWLKFKFLTGQLAEKTVWMCDEGNRPGSTFVYRSNCSDDGFMFNPDPAKPTDEGPGDGDFVPALERHSVSL